MSNAYDDVIALAPGEVPWLAKFQALATQVKADMITIQAGGFSNELTYGARTISSATGVTLTNANARFQKVTMTATSQAVDMPDATTETEGRPWQVLNAGSNDFAIKDNGGNDLVAAVAAGELYEIWLVDDSTTDGVWTVAKLAGSSAPTTAIGTIQMKAGSTLPSGWLNCDGSEVSRSTYADLFAEIDETYGNGDGSTTFNLPDMRGRAVAGVNNSGLPNGANGSYSTRNETDTTGAETHQLTTSEMPSHSHGGSVGNVTANGQGGGNPSLWNAGSTSSTGGDAAHNNMQPTIFVPFIIYAGV